VRRERLRAQGITAVAELEDFYRKRIPATPILP
jgi:hypothetical protein